MNPERVVVAEILRPRGNRGEVLARSQTDVPRRLETLKDAWVHLMNGSDEPVRIAEAWLHKEDWVLRFEGVDSISSAERFRGADLWVPRSERGSLAEGEWFRTDLVGCSLVEAQSGRLLGVVEGWQQYGGGPPLIETTVEGREVLVPFVPEICSAIDLDGRTIRVNPPAGLMHL